MGYYGRYYWPSLPFLVVCAGICLSDFLSREEKKMVFASGGLAVRVLAVIFLFYVNFAMHGENSRTIFTGLLRRPYKIDWLYFREYGMIKEASENGRIWWDVITDMAEIAKGFPEGTVMAATEHGYMGFCAPHVTIIDITGLGDKHIARNGFSAE